MAARALLLETVVLLELLLLDWLPRLALLFRLVLVLFTGVVLETVLTLLVLTLPPPPPPLLLLLPKFISAMLSLLMILLILMPRRGTGSDE